jgi:hypothetical protein
MNKNTFAAATIQTPSSVDLYPVNTETIILGCNEFEDVMLSVSNVSTVEEAQEKAKEFLEHVIKNHFHFSTPE